MAATAAAAYLILSADTFKTVIGKGELVAKQRISCWTHLGKESYLQYDVCRKAEQREKKKSSIMWQQQRERAGSSSRAQRAERERELERESSRRALHP